MTDYAKINLSEVKDLAPDYGMADFGEARFARSALGAESCGASYYRVNPDHRIAFGHRHEADDEMYLVLSGNGRFKVGDDILDVGPRDLVFVPAQTIRAWEAGPDGMELVAFGTHGGGEAEMVQGWWDD